MRRTDTAKDTERNTQKREGEGRPPPPFFFNTFSNLFFFLPLRASELVSHGFSDLDQQHAIRETGKIVHEERAGPGAARGETQWWRCSMAVG